MVDLVNWEEDPAIKANGEKNSNYLAINNSKQKYQTCDVTLLDESQCEN